MSGGLIFMALTILMTSSGATGDEISRSEAIAKVKAEQMLDSVGKLEGLPRLDDFSSRRGFFRALEEHCAAPSGSIRVGEDGSVRFNAPMDPTEDGVEAFDRGICVVWGLTAQRDAASRLGVKFGPIGAKEGESN